MSRNSRPPEPPVRTAARLLHARGFETTLIPAAEKNPTDRWPGVVHTPDDYKATDNLGLKCGARSDGGRPDHSLVVLDLDGDDAVLTADAHLPPTGMADGRPGRPRSHRAYLIPNSTIPEWAKGRAKQSAAAAVEKTGSPGPFTKSFRHRETNTEVVKFLGTGGQVVCPPSVWASADGTRTEVREWEGGEPGEPAVVPFPVLWAAVCDLAASCGCEIPKGSAGPAPRRASTRRAGANGLARAAKYLPRCPESVSGQGGHKALMWAARVLVRGFVLAEDEAFDLLSASFNPRCLPPWSPAELRHKVSDAANCPFDKPVGWLRDADRPNRMPGAPRTAARGAASPGLEEPGPPDDPDESEPGPPRTPDPGPAGGKQVVQITTDEDAVTTQVVGVLARADMALYQRMGRLVETVERAGADGSPVVAVVEVETPNVRQRITRHVDLVRYDEKKGWLPAHPPTWLPQEISAMNRWPGVRELVAVSGSPVLRLDGSIHKTPGYDARTGVLYVPGGEPDPIPDDPTRGDAAAAARRLLHGVRQFPWRSEADQSAWLSLVVTLAVRHAFDGAAPLFYAGGNAARPQDASGLGKGALTSAAAIIGTGRDAPTTAYPMAGAGPRNRVEDEAEIRKIATSVAVEAHAIYRLDNVPAGHEFGSAALDAAVTTTVSGGRLFGTTTAPERAVTTVWVLTGNCIQPKGDTVRRAVPIRLDGVGERPAEREYEGPEVTAWARANREALFADCLTLVAAYIRAGRPDMHLPHFGGFEGWSDTVRSAVVWAELPDPLLTRYHAAPAGAAPGPHDAAAAGLIDLIDAASPEGDPVTASQIAKLVDDGDGVTAAAFNKIFPKAAKDAKGRTDVHRLGMLLKRHRGRPVCGRRINAVPDRKGIARWFLELLGACDAPDASDEPESAGGAGGSAGVKTAPPALPPAQSSSFGEATCDEVPGVPGVKPKPYAHMCARPHTHESDPQSSDLPPAPPANDRNGHVDQDFKVPGVPRGVGFSTPGTASDPPQPSPPSRPYVARVRMASVLAPVEITRPGGEPIPPNAVQWKYPDEAAWRDVTPA